MPCYMQTLAASLNLVLTAGSFFYRSTVFGNEWFLVQIRHLVDSEYQREF